MPATTNRFRLYTLDQDGTVIELRDFRTSVEAMQAAYDEAGEEMEWGDTQIGTEAMREADIAAMNDSGDYPSRYWQIVGIDPETGEDAEYDDSHEDEDDVQP